MTNNLDNIKMTEIQVIEENGKLMRVYNIVDLYLAKDDDPLTTIVVDGYEEVPINETN